MVKRVHAASDAQVNGTTDMSDDYVGSGVDHVRSFDTYDVADFHVANVVLGQSQAKTQNGKSTYIC